MAGGGGWAWGRSAASSVVPIHTLSFIIHPCPRPPPAFGFGDLPSALGSWLLVALWTIRLFRCPQWCGSRQIKLSKCKNNCEQARRPLAVALASSPTSLGFCLHWASAWPSANGAGLYQTGATPRETTPPCSNGLKARSIGGLGLRFRLTTSPRPWPNPTQSD